MKLDKSITTEELMSLDYKYHYSKEELIKDWNKLKNTTEYKKGSQFRPGIKLCQHFFPNFFDIKDSKGKSFADCWNDYEVMDKVREWGLTGMSNLWMSWIRRAVYMTGGLPNSSFYRPHFSKQIIESTGKQEGILFDPCAGWGGRMLGTLAANWNYIACEPNAETYDYLKELLLFIEEEATLFPDGAEHVTVDNVDVVLTSPPYFNLEVYNDDEEQCYNQYKTYEAWRDGWLFPLITSCLKSLKHDGISCWNVMNFKGNDVVGDVIELHKSLGWEVSDTYGFNSPLANIRNLKNKDVTYAFKMVQ